MKWEALQGIFEGYLKANHSWDSLKHKLNELLFHGMSFYLKEGPRDLLQTYVFGYLASIFWKTA
jgi:hypothetical protein